MKRLKAQNAHMARLLARESLKRGEKLEISPLKLEDSMQNLSKISLAYEAKVVLDLISHYSDVL